MYLGSGSQAEADDEESWNTGYWAAGLGLGSQGEADDEKSWNTGHWQLDQVPRLRYPGRLRRAILEYRLLAAERSALAWIPRLRLATSNPGMQAIGSWARYRGVAA